MLGFMDAYDTDTDDWSTYVERLDLFFLANKIKDNKKVAVLLTVLGTKAYGLLLMIIASSKPTKKTYKQLVDAIKSYVEPKSIVITEHFWFHCQDQKEWEILVQYLAQLCKLTEHCEFLGSISKKLSKIGWFVEC